MRGLAATLLLGPACATAASPGRFIEVDAPAPDAGVWYYEAVSEATSGPASATALYFIDIHYPPGDHWAGHCPGGIDIKAHLQRVTAKSIAGLPGRLLAGSGTTCEPPCRHFNCSLLPPDWKPAPLRNFPSSGRPPRLFQEKIRPLLQAICTENSGELCGSPDATRSAATAPHDLRRMG